MEKRSEEAIARLVADWPEMTAETKGKLKALLSPDTPGDPDVSS